MLKLIELFLCALCYVVLDWAQLETQKCKSDPVTALTEHTACFRNRFDHPRWPPEDMLTSDFQIFPPHWSCLMVSTQCLIHDELSSGLCSPECHEFRMVISWAKMDGWNMAEQE